MTAAPLADLPPWWRDLARRAAEPPRHERIPLRLAGAAPATIGSIEPQLAARLHAAGLALAPVPGAGIDVRGDAAAALRRIAHWLHDHGLASRWRDELLAVTDDTGAVHAAVERAAVRPLGIATFAVHLIAFTREGSVWVQQRALDKATDPGQWDTLVGGLVGAAESVRLALERETWEEAGLRIADLVALRPADRLTIRRPVPEGYMVEHIEVFEAVLAAGQVPANQDGEVAGFGCLGADDLVARLAAGAFTLEAALMLAASLRRRGLL